MKTRALLLLICLVIPMQHAVIGQQARAPRIANDFCYPWDRDNGWTEFDICEVQIFDADSVTYIPGVSPAWSPDGLRIAYLNGDLHIYDRTTDAIVRVTNGWPVSGPVSWSRDGGRIAFVGLFEGASGPTYELAVIDPDGSNLTRLTPGVGLLAGYAWSPRGDAIAFGRDNGGVSELYVMSADGSNARRLTYGAGFRGTISWSPDGGKIAFDCGTTICAIRPDGTNLVQLLPAGSNASGATFSPVGGDIAFLGVGGLSVLRADGSIIAVAPGFPATQPTWSPDGGSLAFVVEETQAPGGGACNGDGSPCGRTPAYTYAVKADGSGLFTFGAHGTNPAWFIPPPGQPAAAFTATCSGRTCQFDAAGSSDLDGAIVNYEWKFGDGTTGSGATAEHTYSYSGGSRYAATLIVTDDDGQRDATRGQTFTLVDAPPTPSFTFVCTGLTCTFDASASSDDGSISSYEWYFQDGAYGNGPKPSHRYLSGGTYWVTLRVTDNFYQSGSVTRTVTVVAPPPPTMHVGDLDGSSTTAQRSWSASVTVELHTENHGSVAGVAVSGVWEDGSTGTCTTEGAGRCSVTRGGISRKISSASFRVTGASRSSFVFSPGASHDADGDSNGTTVVIRRQ